MAAPVVSSASANSVSCAGGTVTIGGLSFGTAGPTATASMTAADVCGSSAWSSATTVACAPQAYRGWTAVRTAVSVSGVAGTLTGRFSFDGALGGNKMLACATSRYDYMECYSCSAGREHDFGHFGKRRA